jgi:signal peptidase II
LIIGGALGNALDRIIHGQVVDFIQWYWRDWYWPAFNLADAAIVLGVAILVMPSGRRSSATPGSTPASGL